MYIFDLDVGKDLGENQVKHKTCLFGNIATQITFGPVRLDSTQDIFVLKSFLYLKKGSLLDVWEGNVGQWEKLSENYLANEPVWSDTKYIFQEKVKEIYKSIFFIKNIFIIFSI